MLTLLIFALMLSLIGLEAPLHAADYYASPSGNSSNPCTQVSPCDIVTGQNKGGGGDTLYVRGGTYSQGLGAGNSQIGGGASWTNAWTIQAFPGETPILPEINFTRATQYVIVDGLVFDGGGVREVGIIWHADHIRIQNSIIRNASAQGLTIDYTSAGNELLNSQIYDNGHACDGSNQCHGMYVKGPSTIIRNNRIHHNSAFGIHMYCGECPTVGFPGASNSIIDGNDIHHNNIYGAAGAGAVVLSYGTNIQFSNNLVYANGGDGSGAIWVYTNAVNPKLYHNTIYGNTSDAGIQVYSATGADIRNNIVYGNGGTIGGAGGSNTCANNLAQATASGCSGMIVGPPLFADAANGDFHLTSGSTALDAVACLGSVATDFEGTTRPQGTLCDAGADELLVTTAPTPTQVEFGVQPSTTVAGSTITPRITVRVEDSNGTLQPTTDAITLSLVGTLIPQASLIAVSADSTQSPAWRKELAIDGDVATGWHTQFSVPIPPQPHNIVLSFPTGNVNGVVYTPRPGPDTSGQIVGYNVYVSPDGVTWGTAVATGSFGLEFGGKTYGISWTPKNGSYLKFESTSSRDGAPYTSVAELQVMVSTAVGLEGVLTQSAVGGIATFTVNVPVAGTGYMIKATSGVLNSQLSKPFTITSLPSLLNDTPPQLQRVTPGR